VRNSGYVAADYTVTVSNCSAGVAPVVAQSSGIQAQSNHLFQFELAMQQAGGSNNSCTVAVMDQLGASAASQPFSFYANASDVGSTPDVDESDIGNPVRVAAMRVAVWGSDEGPVRQSGRAPRVPTPLPPRAAAARRTTTGAGALPTGASRRVCPPTPAAIYRQPLISLWPQRHLCLAPSAMLPLALVPCAGISVLLPARKSCAPASPRHYHTSCSACRSARRCAPTS
jgi:hypothetical protein